MAMTSDTGDDLVARIAAHAIAVAVAHFERLATELGVKQRAVIEAEVRAEFAGQTVRVGKGTAARLAERNAAIRADHAGGLSVDELARTYHLSRGHVGRILVGRR